MSLIKKAYFTLEELEERWSLPQRDVAYLAENGLLRLSIRLFGVEMEFGVYEEGSDGEWFTVPYERRRFTGFQDLQERDVFRVFRQGQVDVVHFHAPEKEYRYLIEPTRTVSVCRDDLLVRRDERDRVEVEACARAKRLGRAVAAAGERLSRGAHRRASVQSRARAGARRQTAARCRHVGKSLV